MPHTSRHHNGLKITFRDGGKGRRTICVVVTGSVVVELQAGIHTGAGDDDQQIEEGDGALL